MSIQQDLDLLYQLHTLDSMVAQLRRQADRSAHSAQALVRQKQELDVVAGDQRQHFDALHLEQQELEHAIQITTDQIGQIEVKLKKVRTNEAQQTLLQQIEDVRAKLSASKQRLDEVAVLQKQLRVELADAGHTIEKKQSEVYGQQGKAAIDEAAIQSELRNYEVNRAEVIKTITNQPLLQKYESIFTKEGVAMARVTKAFCENCKMTIPARLFQDVQRRETVNQCPNCRCLLYWKEEEK